MPTYNPYENQRRAHGSRVIVRHSAKPTAEDGISFTPAEAAIMAAIEALRAEVSDRDVEHTARLDEVVEMLGDLDRRLT